MKLLHNNKNGGDLRSFIADMQKDKKTLEMLIVVLLRMKDTKYNGKEIFKDGSLKYTEKELELIEQKINDVFPQGHEPLPTTLIPFGFYLGELMIRKIPGAKWKITDEVNASNNVFDIFVEFEANGGTMQMFPFKRAHRFWMKREDRMSAMVLMIEITSEITMDKEYWSLRTDKDGWITMASGCMLRLFQAENKNDMSTAKGVFHDGKFEDR